MSIRLIDAHVHLQDDRITARADELIGRAEARGVLRLFCNATREQEWESILVMARRYTDIFPFIGIHPWFAETAGKGWEERLVGLLAKGRGNIGVGEIGLDKNSSVEFSLQKKLCATQLEIGIELDLPICIHCIRSWDVLFDLLEATAIKSTLPSIMIHSFNGSVETLRRLTELGCFISFSSRIMESGNTKVARAFMETPLETLLLESDAPDQLHPEIGRQLELVTEYNEPAAVTAIYREAAHLRGMHLQDFAARIWNNATIFTHKTAPR